MNAFVSPPLLKHELLEATAAIIGSVDERARAMNRKWGQNRLPHLVPIDWMERFKSQAARYNRTAFECAGSPLAEDVDRLRKQAEAMIRAYDKLEALAVEEGFIPAPPQQWQFELSDGTPVILVRDRAELAQVDAKGLACQIWSLEEIAQVIAKFPKIAFAKQAFPGAEVIQMRTSPLVIDDLNDSLAEFPFA